jgi:hypothetical protein
MKFLKIILYAVFLNFLSKLRLYLNSKTVLKQCVQKMVYDFLNTIP